jgi:hypothetical protein
MLRRVAISVTLPADYPDRMRRLFSVAFRLACIAAIVAVARQLMLERAPERAIDGTKPVLGSLDTWPAVPRKPA